jgi:hypothetical protein
MAGNSLASFSGESELPIRNSPAGISTSVMPMELVIVGRCPLPTAADRTCAVLWDACARTMIAHTATREGRIVEMRFIENISKLDRQRRSGSILLAANGGWKPPLQACATRRLT